MNDMNAGRPAAPALRAIATTMPSDRGPAAQHSAQMLPRPSGIRLAAWRVQ
jgi:hypothetical protein